MVPQVITLDMGLLVAGTKYRGEFEERLKKLMEEIKQNDDIILVRPPSLAGCLVSCRTTPDRDGHRCTNSAAIRMPQLFTDAAGGHMPPKVPATTLCPQVQLDPCSSPCVLTALQMIDEVHTLIGAGAAEGAIDAANILKPALARGELQCIGATTLDEYRKHIEKDPALERCVLMAT